MGRLHYGLAPRAILRRLLLGANGTFIHCRCHECNLDNSDNDLCSYRENRAQQPNNLKTGRGWHDRQRHLVDRGLSDIGGLDRR